MTKKPDGGALLQGFLKKAKAGDCQKLAEAEEASGHRHLQVRLTLRDAKRFRCLSDLRDLTIQDALVNAINSLLGEWCSPPVENPGARGKRTEQ